ADAGATRAPTASAVTVASTTASVPPRRTTRLYATGLQRKRRAKSRTSPGRCVSISETSPAHSGGFHVTRCANPCRGGPRNHDPHPGGPGGGVARKVAGAGGRLPRRPPRLGSGPPLRGLHDRLVLGLPHQPRRDDWPLGAQEDRVEPCRVLHHR